MLEWLEGRTLREHVEAEVLSITQLLDRGLQIADALDVAHAHGIVHRDIKPANIFRPPIEEIMKCCRCVGRISARHA